MSTFTSYARPEHPINRAPVAAPPPTLPYLPPPGGRPPPLPARPSLPVPPGWTRTQHAVPAAFPRRFAESFGSLTRESRPQALDGAAQPDVGETKEQRTARNEGEVRNLLQKRYDAQEGDGASAEQGLWMAAERWCRSSTPAETDGSPDEGLTIVMTHANGLHKEMWYPTLHRLLSSSLPKGASYGSDPSDQPHGTTAEPPRIEEIWLFDDIHHGTSIDLNAGRIGPVHCWSDGGRDIVNFLLHVWKQDSSSKPGAYPDEAVGWHEAPSASKRKGKKVIGVGHSFGGNALVQAAAERPDLFHALFLIDPMCPAWSPPRSSLHTGSIARWWPLVMGAVKRRTTWPSLEEAKKLRRSPFFGAWHEEVWSIFLSHGLVSADTPSGSQSAREAGDTGAVQLATPSWAEAAVFGEPTGLAEGWDRLVHIPPEVKVGFLMANEPKATFGEKMTRELVWRAPGSANEIVPDAGHLAVQERPDRVADALARFIGSLSSGRYNGASGVQAKL